MDSGMRKVSMNEATSFAAYFQNIRVPRINSECCERSVPATCLLPFLTSPDKATLYTWLSATGADIRIHLARQ